MSERKNILLTGAAGYISDGITELLLNFPVNIVAVDNLLYGGAYMRNHRDREGTLDFHRLDITDTEKLLTLLKSRKWDTVTHLAAIVGDGACCVDQNRTTEVNENATKVIAEYCKDNNIKMIFASTCSVYGAAHGILNEDSETNPLSLYAGTKLNSEKFIQKVPSHFIFRLGTVFGISTEFARLRCDLIANILTYKAAQGEKLTVFGGEQFRPLIHVRDIGRIMSEAIINKHTPGTYILSYKNFTILEIAKEVQRIVGGEISTTDMKFEDLRNYQVDNSKAKKEGFAAWIDLASGIREMALMMKEGRIADVWSPSFHNEKWLKSIK